MTNEQLYVFLQAQISELKETLNQCHKLMPEDAPKVKVTRWKLKPEYENQLILIVTHGMKEYVEEDTGDYEALVPLQELIEEFELRAGCLIKIQEIKLREIDET